MVHEDELVNKNTQNAPSPQILENNTLFVVDTLLEKKVMSHAINNRDDVC